MVEALKEKDDDKEEIVIVEDEPKTEPTEKTGVEGEEPEEED